jgi:hypothetical protein
MHRVTFRVVRAHDVPQMDAIHGTSDPYVTVAVNSNVVFRTPTQQKTTHPTFDSTCTVRVSDVDAINVSLWDDEPYGEDELIGTVEIQADSFIGGGRRSEWFRFGSANATPQCHMLIEMEDQDGKGSNKGMSRAGALLRRQPSPRASGSNAAPGGGGGGGSARPAMGISAPSAAGADGGSVRVALSGRRRMDPERQALAKRLIRPGASLVLLERAILEGDSDFVAGIYREQCREFEKLAQAANMHSFRLAGGGTGGGGAAGGSGIPPSVLFSSADQQQQNRSFPSPLELRSSLDLRADKIGSVLILCMKLKSASIVDLLLREGTAALSA